jgi:hypothetical protein
MASLAGKIAPPTSAVASSRRRDAMVIDPERRSQRPRTDVFLAGIYED